MGCFVGRRGLFLGVLTMRKGLIKSTKDLRPEGEFLQKNVKPLPKAVKKESNEE